LVGNLGYGEHRSITEIHQALRRRGLAIAPRTVTNLRDRYDEILAVTLTDDRRLRDLLAEQGRVILAVDGLQPDVGHEVLCVLLESVLCVVSYWQGGQSWRGPVFPGTGRRVVPSR
jgi:hypothetical protein